MTQIMWVESRETVETTAFPVVKFCLLIPLVVYLVGLGYFCGSAAVLAEILNEGKVSRSTMAGWVLENTFHSSFECL